MLNYSNTGTNRISPAASISCLNPHMSVSGAWEGPQTTEGEGGGRQQGLRPLSRSLQPHTALFPVPGCGIPGRDWRCGDQTLAGASLGACRCDSQVCHPPDAGTVAACFCGDHKMWFCFPLSSQRSTSMHQGFVQDISKSEMGCDTGTWESFHNSRLFLPPLDRKSVV